MSQRNISIPKVSKAAAPSAHVIAPDDDSAALATKLLRHLLSTVQRCRAWWGGHECGIVHQLL
jgi:hypothetical protein